MKAVKYLEVVKVQTTKAWAPKEPGVAQSDDYMGWVYVRFPCSEDLLLYHVDELEPVTE